MSRRIVSTLVLGLGGAALFLACDDTPELGAGASFDASVPELDASFTPPDPQRNVDGLVDGGIDDEDAAPPPATYAITAKVIGLRNAGLKLVDPAGGTITVEANGGADVVASFPNRVLAGTAYAVAIDAQPTAQRCELSGNTGTVVGGDITSIVVNCTGLFTVGGSVSGLDGKGLTLQSGNEIVAANGNGTFAFSTPLPTGTDWSVAVKTQPTNAWQTCSVTPASGKIGTASVTDVRVTCVSTPYRVAVTVSGLAGSGLVLRNNGDDDLRPGANGTFTFAQQVPSGKAYDVTVPTQPSGPTQTCTVASPKGTIANADVTLAATCTTASFAVGGVVNGLKGTKLVLTDGTNDVTVDKADKFVFPRRPSGTTYAISVKSPPAGVQGEYCRVTAGASGTIGGGNIDGVVVTCGVGRTVFVSSTVFAATALSNADNLCNDLAKKAGLTGVYRAWLSDEKRSPAATFEPSKVPYVLVDGRIVANDWAELSAGKLGAPISVTERAGKPPVSTGTCAEETVWTNTLLGGSSAGSATSCGNWSGGGEQALFGAYTKVEEAFTNACTYAGRGVCSLARAPIYCFEQPR